MRYNITRLINEIQAYREQYEHLDQVPAEHRNYKRNQLRHAIALCQKYIAQEVEERIMKDKEGRSLDDTNELDDWEFIKYLPVRAISKDKARALMSNAVNFAERVGYRVEYMLHEA